MERKCSVCGSPMMRTSTGYRCSFCANIESLDAKAAGYAGKPNVSGNASRSRSEKRQRIIVVVATSLICFIVAFIYGFIAVKQRREREEILSRLVIMEEETADFNNQMEAGEGQQQIQSNAMKQALEDMFQKPFEEVTEQEIQTVRYLEVDISARDHCCTISYSFEDYRDYASDGMTPETFPYNKEFLATIKTNTYMDEELYGDAINLDVQHFNGVSGLCLNDYYYIDLSMFTNLSYVNAGNGHLEQVLEAGAPAENITALKLSREENIPYITEFTSLKQLCLDCCEQDVLENIVECQTLEELYCMDMPGVKSLNDIGQLTNLKTLYIYGSSDGLKDLSMISGLTNLEHLAIVDTDILDINFLAGFSGLKSLRLSENGELQDYSALGDLTGLEYLDFDLSALHGNQPEYKGIGNLKNLKQLSLDTVYDLDFLYELTNLEELKINLCFFNYLLEPIRNMKQLETLALSNCNSQYPDGFACLSELPELKSFTIEGMSFEDGVDGLFALDNLEQLRIQNCKFYTAPAYIAASERLKVLEMDHVEFITMPGPESEYYFVGYYDEEIAQNILNQYGACSGLEELYLDGFIAGDLSFLNNLSQLRILSMEDCEIQEIAKENMANCRKLEELNLKGNKISRLDFAENLVSLKKINLKDCYVSDLSPLSSCKKLQYVNVKDNPVSINPLEKVMIEE